MPSNAEAARVAAGRPSPEPWICHLERLVRMMQSAEAVKTPATIPATTDAKGVHRSRATN